MKISNNILDLEQQDKFKDLLERLNVIAYEFDLAKHCFIYVSKQAEAILGYSLEEWMERGFWYNHIHPDDRKSALEFSMLNTKLNMDHEYEYRMISKDSSVKWFRDITSVRNEDGFPVIMQGILVNITAQKEIEHRLIRSEARYRALVEDQTEMITRWLPDGTFTFVNDVFCSFFHKNREELIGNKFVPDMPPEDIENFKEFFSKLTAQNPIGHFTHRVITDDRNIKWLRWTDRAITDENGKIIEYQTVGRDITSRKLAEERLRETELRLSSLFDNLHDVVFYESNSESTFITQNVFKMLGYTEKELSETSGLFYSLIHPEDVQKVNEAFEKWRTIEQNATSSLEIRLRRKDGEYIWVEDRMFAVVTPSRSYWAGFMIDITEKRKSESKLAETEKRLSSILNNLSNIVFYENEDDLVFISENVYEMLGYSAEEFYSEKSLYSSLVHPDDYERVYSKINEWFKNGEEGSIKSEFRIRKKDGSYIWVEDIMFTVVTGSRKYWTGFFVDVSDRKYAEEKLSETSKRLTTIVDNLTNLTIYETGGGKNYISENIEKLTGIPLQKFKDDIRLFGSLIHPEDLKKLDKRVRDWNKNGAKGVISSEFRLRKPDGRYSWIEDHMFKVDNDKDGVYLSGIMIDITETKAALEKIQETEIRLSTILSNLPKIVIYQAGRNKDFISENISEMIGYSPGEILKEKYFFGKIMHVDDYNSVKEKLINWKASKTENPVLNMDYRLKKKDGDYVWIEDHMFEVTPEGQEPYISGILIDVTERKQTEETITQSLREKEVLLKEIHHRVKNNLQVVSSLLKLQSSFLKDSTASNILLESQNRIRSMALVHQKLYQSKDFAQVDFLDYVQQLTMNLMNVYKQTSRNIRLNINSDNIFIGIDVAVPCGLIVNELVSNALKYAFNGCDSGKIDINMKRTSHVKYEISVADDGIGFPENIDFRNTQTLGLQLVNTLVKQIDGKIQLLKGNGTSFVITFEDDSNRKSRFPFEDATDSNA